MAPETVPRARSALVRESWKALVWALPAGLAAHFLGELVGSVSEHPIRVLGALLPVGVAVALLVRPLVRNRRLMLGGGVHGFLIGYILFFSLAAGSDVLNGRRVELAGYGESVPSNFLGLGRFGDWHYWVLPPADPARDLILVTFPSFEGDTTWQARRTEMSLIRSAVEEEAEGIAFDYVLREPSIVDPVLCTWIGRAEEAGVEVILGYTLSERQGRLVRDSLAPAIQECVPEERLGSLTGYQEADGLVRMVPLFVEGDETRGSLSYRIAQALPGGSAPPPRDGLLQFTEAVIDTFRIRDADAWPDADALALFRDRFVIVGSHREGDMVETPFGTWAGVKVHANAAHSLREGHFVRRVPRAWHFPLIFVLCYVLGALQLRGGTRPLLVGAAALSVAVFAMAVAAMRSAWVWIDVSYPLTAMWLLVPVLRGGALVQQARARALSDRPAPGPVDAEHPGEGQGHDGVFDVFLSYNRSDVDTVETLARDLSERGLQVWLDRWYLVPGRSWQEGVEAVIETTASAAVFVGPDDLGPWEAREVRVLLDQLVERDLPVIPVLLPGASQTPDIPPFLRTLSWVDLRGGVTEDGLDQLEWGITGVRPGRSRAGKASTTS